MSFKATLQTPALAAGVLLFFSILPAMSYSAGPDDVDRPGTRVFTLESTETGHDYLIQVAQPEAPPPASGYPVLYLLDGNAYLPLAQAARDTLMRESPRHGSPLMIVAIGYPGVSRFDFERRALDYTPPRAERNQAGRSHGGADRFLAFINNRLKPEIARRYPVDADREALFGHSFGGLFVLHVLLSAPDTFERYIAISPSLWWYGEQPVRALARRAPPEQTGGGSPRLLVGVGGQEQTPDASEKGTAKAEQIRARSMVDNVQEVAGWLANQYPHWRIESQVFPGEGHGSVMWPAARRMMEFLHPNGENKTGVEAGDHVDVPGVVFHGNEDQDKDRVHSQTN